MWRLFPAASDRLYSFIYPLLIISTLTDYCLLGVGKRCNFCFESTSWREIVGTANAMVVLDKVFRQKDDRFLRLLNEMRTGSLSPKSIAICRMKVAEYQRASVPRQMESPAIECTKLFSTNVGVDEVRCFRCLWIVM